MVNFEEQTQIIWRLSKDDYDEENTEKYFHNETTVSIKMKEDPDKFSVYARSIRVYNWELIAEIKK